MTVVCNDEGIEWDYIVYQHEHLSQIRVHLKQRNGFGDRGGLFWVNRDLQDLGRIWVSAPDRKARIEVPAVRADYAAGLTLNQHRAIVAHHQRTVGKFVDVDGLLRTRGAMLVEIERLRVDVHRIKDLRAFLKRTGGCVGSVRQSAKWTGNKYGSLK